MQTDWDYTALADFYLKRPSYSQAAIDEMLAITKLPEQAHICDVGAGTANLTLMLAVKGYEVVAVEPNDAMRATGMHRTTLFCNVRWFEGTGEATRQADQKFDLVTFGSSFNVCDRTLALKEAARLLKPGRWFACIWNHRDLEDPIQSDIESIIKTWVPVYSYGMRREDQTEIITSSGFFHTPIQFDVAMTHTQNIGDCTDAWRSHATLQRQAGQAFESVVAEIDAYLKALGVQTIQVPYRTNIYLAQLR